MAQIKHRVLSHMVEGRSKPIVWLSTWVCACVCRSICLCEQGCRSKVMVGWLPQLFPLYFLRRRLINLKLTSSSTWAGQWTRGLHSLPSVLGLQAHHHAYVFMGARDPNTAMQAVYPKNHLPSPWSGAVDHSCYVTSIMQSRKVPSTRTTPVLPKPSLLAWAARKGSSVVFLLWSCSIWSYSPLTFV